MRGQAFDSPSLRGAPTMPQSLTLKKSIMNKIFTVSTTIFLASLFVILFIYFNNDHNECKTIITTSFGNQGEKIVKENHICNEKYSF
jgi:hypothetical protein